MALVLAQTFALASGFAGLAGYVMTMFDRAGYADDDAYEGRLRISAASARSRSSRRPSHRRLRGDLVDSAFPIDYRDVAIFSLLAILLTLRPGGHRLAGEWTVDRGRPDWAGRP